MALDVGGIGLLQFLLIQAGGDDCLQGGDTEALLERADHDEIGDVPAVILLFDRFGHDLFAHIVVDGGRCDYESKIRPSSCPIKNLSDVEEYNKICEERDRLKEENTNWKIICNALVNNNDLPTYKGADDFV